MVKHLAFIALIPLLLVGCSKDSISERDAKKAQLTNAAEIKKKELMVVAGNFAGELTQSSGLTQAVTLKLDIKEIPTQVEGQVDPVMMPILTGYLRFNFAGGTNPSEFIGFAISKAEFDPLRSKLDIVATHNDYKDLIAALQFGSGALQGSWTAPALAVSGTLYMKKSDDPTTGPLAEELRGEYGGVLYREKGAYQYGHLTLQTAFVPPQGLKVSAVFRVIFGEWKSSEYLTYRFDIVEFNPLNGQMVLKSSTSDVALTANWSAGKIIGEWSSNFTGKLGGIEMKKNQVPGPVTGQLFEPLKGTYKGKITNTNPQSNLPERILISFVTSQDLTKPNGIAVTGNIRLYLGDFESTEYIELPFEEVTYNFFTLKLVAKTGGEYKLTLKADADIHKLSGTIAADALGEVGTWEAIK